MAEPNPNFPSHQALNQQNCGPFGLQQVLNQQNCGPFGLQQVHYGPVPTAKQQLESRAQELRAFLAVDHDAARERAEGELRRIEAALAYLIDPEPP